MRNYLILFFWICISWTDVRAQKKDDDGSYIGFLKTILQDGTYAPMIAYNYNSSCGSIELGIAKGWRCSVNDKGTCSGEIGAPMPYHYLSVSSEFMMNNEKLVVCPKYMTKFVKYVKKP